VFRLYDILKGNIFEVLGKMSPHLKVVAEGDVNSGITKVNIKITLKYL
jgi:hypothetical protein